MSRKLDFNDGFQTASPSTVDILPAAEITNTPSGNLTSTDQQAVNNELQSDIDTRATQTDMVSGDTTTLASANAYTDQEILELINAAPGTLDTLNELATALGDDPNFATTVSTALANRVRTDTDTQGLTDTQKTNAKTNIGLEQVTNDAQLKRAAGDLNTLTEKTTFDDDDILVIEDVTTGYTKKKIKKSNLGISSSGGDVNLITNGDGSKGVTGWTEGSYAPATRPSGTFTPSSGAGLFSISSTTVDPLGNGLTSLVLTKSAGASRQGRTVEKTFPLGLDYRAKMLKIDTHYILNSGTFVAGTSTTDSSMIIYTSFLVGSTWTPKEPTNFKLLSNSTTISTWMGNTEIQTPHDATQMKLILYVAETANSAWELKATFGVSPSKYVYGTPVTDWKAWTPTGSWTTNTTYTGLKRQVGDTMEYDVRVATSGAPNATQLTVNLLETIDTSKLVAPAMDTNEFELGLTSVLDGGISVSIGTVGYATATSVKAYVTNVGGTYAAPGAVSNINPITFGATDTVHLKFSVPVLGLSSSVAMSSSSGSGILPVASYTALSTSAILNLTETTIPLVNKIVDTTGAVSSNQFRVTEPGQYKITINGGTDVSTDTGYVQLKARKSSVDIGIPVKAHSRVGVDTYASGSWVCDAVAGDLLDGRMYYAQGANRNVTASVTFEKLGQNNQTIAASDSITASYKTGAGQSILNTVETTILYGTKIEDSRGIYNTSTGEITIPVAGTYFIEAQIHWTERNAGNRYLGLRNATLGTVLRFIYQEAALGMSIFYQGYFSANEKIIVRVNHSTGSTKSLYADADYNQFSIRKVGN